MIRGMALEELREALDVTQAQRAARLTVNQSAISRLDRRPDMYVGTLRNVIAATGGKLEIRAVFPEGQVAAVNGAAVRLPWRERPLGRRDGV